MTVKCFDFDSSSFMGEGKHILKLYVYLGKGMQNMKKIQFNGLREKAIYN